MTTRRSSGLKLSERRPLDRAQVRRLVNQGLSRREIGSALRAAGRRISNERLAAYDELARQGIESLDQYLASDLSLDQSQRRERESILAFNDQGALRELKERLEPRYIQERLDAAIAGDYAVEPTGYHIFVTVTFRYTIHGWNGSQNTGVATLTFDFHVTGGGVTEANIQRVVDKQARGYIAREIAGQRIGSESEAIEIEQIESTINAAIPVGDVRLRRVN